MHPVGRYIHAALIPSFNSLYGDPEAKAWKGASDLAAFCAAHPNSKAGLREFVRAAAAHEEFAIRATRALKALRPPLNRRVR